MTEPSNATQQPHANIERLESRLGYTFSNKELLYKALTHRSMRGQSASYERLEFLGDSILGFIVADELFKRFPYADEGALTRARSEIVRRESLAACAIDLGLGDYLILGLGELKSGGHRRETILSDVVEAIVAAVYLDADLVAARTVSESILQKPLAQIVPSDVNKDAKTVLQEYLQQDGRELPEYILEKEDGPDHQRTFTVNCVVDAFKTVGIATSRRRAEQHAAELMLQELGLDYGS